jgi:hypothetical protein
MAKGTLVVVHDAATLTAFTGDELTTRSAAGSLAGVTGLVGREVDGRGDALHGVTKAEMEGRL